MIEINIINGEGYVWDTKDIISLRVDHRIVGCLIGQTGRSGTPAPGPPLLLSKQEIQILKDEGIAKLVEVKSLSEPPTESAIKQAEELAESRYQAQIGIMREEKVKLMYSLADKIVAGKRKKMAEQARKKRRAVDNSQDGKPVDDNGDEKSGEQDNQSENIIFDRDEIMRQEIAKIPPISRLQQAVQIFNKQPFISSEDIQPAAWTYPKGHLEETRLVVFKDLWKSGYYLTEASKFGGDFLVYQGDPLKFHAKYLVTCVESEAKWRNKHRPQDLVLKSRIGTTVLKTVLIAWQQRGEIRYKSVVRQRKDVKTMME